MASVQGTILKAVLRRTGNLNPVSFPRAVEKIRRLERGWLNEEVPKDFELQKEQTPMGTRFERLSRKDATPTGRVVYYLHGGAYIAGLLSYYRMFAEDFDRAADGCELVLLDYRCAPDYRYPVQLEEALDVWEELTVRRGYDPQNIVIAGDSAGANLALALMLWLRDNGEALPKAACCLSAWADMTGIGESFTRNYGKDIMFGEKGKKLTEENKRRLWNSEIFCYAGDADRTDPYVSPVYGEYHGFPPMFFAVGDEEMLLSDTLTIAEKLRRQGVPVECDVQPEMFHVYVVYHRLLPEAEESYQKMLRFIRSQWTPMS